MLQPQASLLIRSNLVGTFLAIGLAWALLLAMNAYLDYRTTETRFIEASERSADLIQRHAQWGLEDADKVLRRARDLITSWNRSDPRAGEQISVRLGDLVAASEAVGSIWALDAQGVSLIDHTSATPRRVVAADRPYFRVHAQGHNDVWIGPAGMGTIVPRRRFTLSLPMHIEGQFAGVVVVGSDVEFFTHLYKLVALSSTTTDLALLADNGAVLARWAADSHDGRQEARIAGTLTLSRPIEGFAAHVVVASNDSSLLAEWRHRSLRFAGLSGLGMLGFGGLLFWGTRAARGRVLASEDRLREAQRHARIGCWQANRKTGDTWWSETVYEALGVDAAHKPTISSFLKLVHPEDMATVEATARQLETTRTLDTVFRIVRPDGAIRHIRVRGKVLGDADAPAVWTSGTVQDVTDEQEARAALEDANRLLEAVIEHMPATVFVKRAGDLAFVRFNEAGQRLLGYQGSEILGKTDYDLFPKEQADFFTSVDRSVLEGVGHREIAEEPIRIKDGSVRYLRTSKCALVDSSGKPTHLLGVSLDITPHKIAEERIKLLMRELNHRAKNLLQLVQVIARHTAIDAAPQEFAARFGERLTALAASHDLLARSQWRGVAIGELTRTQLAHFADIIDKRVIFKGPDIRLSPQAAQTLGMALHELATNAAKYGAFSNDEGKVLLEWQVLTRNGGESALQMSWSEQGGPPPKPPQRRGFGFKILTGMVEHALDGSVHIDYSSSGLVWRAVIPVSSAIDARDRGSGGQNSATQYVSL
jgi:PAS domain S-box-containing protein